MRETGKGLAGLWGGTGGWKSRKGLGEEEPGLRLGWGVEDRRLRAVREKPSLVM